MSLFESYIISELQLWSYVFIVSVTKALDDKVRAVTLIADDKKSHFRSLSSRRFILHGLCTQLGDFTPIQTHIFRNLEKYTDSNPRHDDDLRYSHSDAIYGHLGHTTLEK
jgi:hypothetical protein